jgi:hypothetical protein
MRCPKCGFISFDDQVACGKCNIQLDGDYALAFQGTAIRVVPSLFLGSLITPGSRAAEPAMEQEAEENNSSFDLFKELENERLTGRHSGQTQDSDELELTFAESDFTEEHILPQPLASGRELMLDREATSIEFSDSSVLELDEDSSADESSSLLEAAALQVRQGGSEPEQRFLAEEELDLAFPEAADNLDEIDLSDSATMGFGEEDNSANEGNGLLEAAVLQATAGDREPGQSFLENEELDLAPSVSASNLDGIDLSDLMEEEDYSQTSTVGAESAPRNGGAIFDLSDLLTEDGDENDPLRLDTASGDGQAAVVSAEDEELLDLTFAGDEEDDDLLSMDLNLASRPAEEDELDLRLTMDEEENENQVPAAAIEVHLSPSGLSLEKEDEH